MQALKDQGIETLPKGVEIANADDVVDMHDDPATVVKKKKDSSMVVGLTMLKEGGGDAFVSAGSTGALLSAATLIVRRVKGIRRAAMGPQIPTKTGRECVLIDCGATADCTPEFLLQFAFMGSYYAEKVLVLRIRARCAFKYRRGGFQGRRAAEGRSSTVKAGRRDRCNQLYWQH